MNFKEVMIGVLGLVLLICTGKGAEYLLSLETPGVHEFPYVAPWVSISIAAIGILPGIFIGWFAVQRPLVITIAVGFLAGLIETSTLWEGIFEAHHSGNVAMVGPGLADYLASGVTKAMYLCAFTALGVILRMRFSANLSFNATGLSRPAR